MSEQYVLNNTPTVTHRIRLEDGQATLMQETHFSFDASEISFIVFFLQEVKKGPSVRHTYTIDTYTMEYELERYCITQRKTGRVIFLGRSTADRLLKALTGDTERLVKDE